MIRPATVRDADAICAIWNPEIRETLMTFNSIEKTPDDVAAMIQKRGDGFVVFEGNDANIAGFALYGAFRGGVGYRHTCEHTVVLSPAARGQGAGRALLDAICTHAKAAEFHTMIGGISAANPDAVAFHRRLGFEVVGRLPQVGRKFDRWIDLILMQKML